MELEVSLGTGHSTCGCRRCGRVFTCVSAFDRHRRLDARGVSECLNPSEIGLVVNRYGRWGHSSSESFTRLIGQTAA